MHIKSGEINGINLNCWEDRFTTAEIIHCHKMNADGVSGALLVVGADPNRHTEVADVCLDVPTFPYPEEISAIPSTSVGYGGFESPVQESACIVTPIIDLPLLPIATPGQ